VIRGLDGEREGGDAPRSANSRPVLMFNFTADSALDGSCALLSLVFGPESLGERCFECMFGCWYRGLLLSSARCPPKRSTSVLLAAYNLMESTRKVLTSCLTAQNTRDILPRKLVDSRPVIVSRKRRRWRVFRNTLQERISRHGDSYETYERSLIGLNSSSYSLFVKSILWGILKHHHHLDMLSSPTLASTRNAPLGSSLR
jgi:hypothetical protein